MISPDRPEAAVANAAYTSAVGAEQAIEEAVRRNDDPHVDQALQQATVHVQSTVGRTGWLRTFLHKRRSPR
jgi:hypothetical protein